MNEQYERLRAERLAKVNPDYRAMVEGIPPLQTLGVAGMREAFQGLGAAMEITPGVSHRDIEIPGPHGPVPTRIYTPDGYEGPRLGVYLHTHAGGFVSGGGLDTWNWLNTMLAAKVPCVVVAPDFRLPPEHRYPTGLDDCWAVLNWIAEHGAAQGWDTSKIAVGGGCTGGNFAAVLSLMARDAGKPRVSLQILESWLADAHGRAPSHQEFAEGYGLRHVDNEFVIGNYIRNEADRDDWRVSPGQVPSVEGVAPALITVGEWDILRDEDLAYGERLKQAGVPVEVHVIPETGHFPNPDHADRVHGIHIQGLSTAIGPKGPYRIEVPQPVVDAPVAATGGPMRPDGRWTLTVKTPMGIKTDTLELRSIKGGVTGTQTSPEIGTHPDLKIKVDGNTLSWDIPVTKPIKITLKFTVRIDGDAMTGTVKAGMFGKAPLSGVRG
ncbi:MAG: alpha/beta hydrolase [Pseudomonadota bacterium]|nr:alpha/beta hydrolase [Pseudomonadota bacterium]